MRRAAAEKLRKKLKKAGYGEKEIDKTIIPALLLKEAEEAKTLLEKTKLEPKTLSRVEQSVINIETELALEAIKRIPAEALKKAGISARKVTELEQNILNKNQVLIRITPGRVIKEGKTKSKDGMILYETRGLHTEVYDTKTKQRLLTVITMPRQRFSRGTLIHELLHAAGVKNETMVDFLTVKAIQEMPHVKARAKAREIQAYAKGRPISRIARKQLEKQEAESAKAYAWGKRLRRGETESKMDRFLKKIGISPQKRSHRA